MADTERHPRPLLRTLVGEVLRRHRQEQRRTLAEVARQANVSVQYLSEVERGRKEPSSEILAAVCDSLRIELPDLLAEVRRNLLLDRSPAPVLRLATAQMQRSAQTTRPSMHGSGTVMLLAA
ncbi:helix-turn-helix transcriptional regulator [Paractinoplanes ferrugineus]|uniref:Transcriptional regulator n=1 Tax=Paractinoplanes ferrugineus TaxID=113564 RepID=A0A919IWT4_9ACTN|nr:transcriptional regulator [Actinoplanes ferrugineus]